MATTDWTTAAVQQQPLAAEPARETVTDTSNRVENSGTWEREKTPTTGERQREAGKKTFTRGSCVQEQAAECYDKENKKGCDQLVAATHEGQRNRETAAARAIVLPMKEGIEHMLRMPRFPAEEGNEDEEGPGTTRKGPKSASPENLDGQFPPPWPSVPVGGTRTGSFCGILCCVQTATAKAASCLYATCLCIACRDRVVIDECCHSVGDMVYAFKECVGSCGRGCADILRCLAPLAVIAAIEEAVSAVLGCFVRYVWDIICGVLDLSCCECGRGDECC